MRFDELLEMVNHGEDRESKEVVEYLKSYQNRFSSQILRSRIRNHLTKQQAADKVGMRLDEYLSYERGTNMNASEDMYKKVLNKLNAVALRVIPLRIPQYQSVYKENELVAYSNDLDVSENDEITNLMDFKYSPAL